MRSYRQDRPGVLPPVGGQVVTGQVVVLCVTLDRAQGADPGRRVGPPLQVGSDRNPDDQSGGQHDLGGGLGDQAESDTVQR